LILTQLGVLLGESIEVVAEFVNLRLHLTWALQEVDELGLCLVQVFEGALPQETHHVEPLHTVLVVLVCHLLPSFNFLVVGDLVDSSQELGAPDHASRGGSVT